MKKWIAMLLALAMMLSLAACGSGSSGIAAADNGEAGAADDKIAVCLGSSIYNSQAEATAFRNPDGRTAVVLLNRSEASQPVFAKGVCCLIPGRQDTA